MAPELADLVREWHELRGSHASTRPLYARLTEVWRAADDAFVASGDSASLVAKWVCRLLWEQLERHEGAVPDRVKALLARTHVWSLEELVFSVWAASAPAAPGTASWW